MSQSPPTSSPPQTKSPPHISQGIKVSNAMLDSSLIPRAASSGGTPPQPLNSSSTASSNQQRADSVAKQQQQQQRQQAMQALTAAAAHESKPDAAHSASGLQADGHTAASKQNSENGAVQAAQRSPRVTTSSRQSSTSSTANRSPTNEQHRLGQQPGASPKTSQTQLRSPPPGSGNTSRLNNGRKSLPSRKLSNGHSTDFGAAAADNGQPPQLGRPLSNSSNTGPVPHIRQLSGSNQNTSHHYRQGHINGSPVPQHQQQPSPTHQQQYQRQAASQQQQQQQIRFGTVPPQQYNNQHYYSMPGQQPLPQHLQHLPPHLQQQQQLFALQQQLSSMGIQPNQMPQQHSPLHGAPTTATNSPRSSIASSQPPHLPHMPQQHQQPLPHPAHSRQHSASSASPLLPGPTQSNQASFTPMPSPSPGQQHAAGPLPTHINPQTQWVWNPTYQMLMPAAGMQLPMQLPNAGQQHPGQLPQQGQQFLPPQLAAYYAQQQAMLAAGVNPQQQQQRFGAPLQQHGQQIAYNAQGIPMPMYSNQFVSQQQQQHPAAYQQYNQQQQMLQQQQQSPPQSAVLPIAQYPTVTTTFPPSSFVTMPTFEHLVVPNEQQVAAVRQLPNDPDNPPFYSIDVECVATGTGHNDRAIASIAVVDSHENVVLNVYVRPAEPVVSCLTQLTGITEQHLDSGMTLDEALAYLRSIIPSHAILVGQNILKDVQWLELRQGTDFHEMLDLAGAWRVRNTQYNNWSMFSLSHESKALLGVLQNEPHHAVDDALLSIKLYKLWKHLSQASEKDNLSKAHTLLLEQPMDQSFSKRFPEIDGVCLGNKKLCKCNQAWLNF